MGESGKWGNLGNKESGNWGIGELGNWRIGESQNRECGTGISKRGNFLKRESL